MTKSQFQTLPVNDRLNVIDQFIEQKNEEFSDEESTQRVEYEDIELVHVPDSPNGKQGTGGLFVYWKDPEMQGASQSPRVFEVVTHRTISGRVTVFREV